MKIRKLILFVLAALTLLSACGKGKKGSETLAETEPTPVVTATPEPLPEPGTVVLDPEKGISATFGVAEGDAEEVEEEEPTATPTPTAAPSPTASPTPVPVPEDPAQTAYELFYAMSPEQKDAFLNSFESYEAFYEWLVAAQAEFKEKHPDIEIGPGGVIDLSEYAQ